MNECLNRLSDERLLETEQRLRLREQRKHTDLTRLKLISKCYKQLCQTNTDTNRKQLKLNLLALKSLKSCEILLSRIDTNQHVMDITDDYHMNECHKTDDKIKTKDLGEKSDCYVDSDSTNNCIEINDCDGDRNNNENYNNITVTRFVFDTISSADKSVIDNNSNISRAVIISIDKCDDEDIINSHSKQKLTNTGYSATDEIIAESILEKWFSDNKINTENSRPSLKWKPKTSALIKRKRGRPRSDNKLMAKQSRPNNVIKLTVNY